MKSRVAASCLVGILALVLFVPGCKKQKASSDNSDSQTGNNPFTSLQNSGGGGVAQNVRLAAARTFTLVEMDNLAKWYFQYVLANNMAPKEETLAQDRQMGSIYKAVKDGDLVVIWPTQPTTSEEVFAYPKEAANLQSIPIALCNGRARNASKQEFDTLVKSGK
jgi:hypothetical protein